MIFTRVEPPSSIGHWVECFWVIENDDANQVTQKIIPDGFPELIFHFGEPYEINLHGCWERQGKALLAGQIKKFFWLRNTGAAKMLGIKMKPTTPTFAFGIAMTDLTDQVAEVHRLNVNLLSNLTSQLRSDLTFEGRIQTASEFFGQLPEKIHPIHDALEIIFRSRGVSSVTELRKKLGVSERQLERLFKRYVGLNPKFYSRVIRFSTIFQLKEQGDPSWIDLTYDAGYADQSHFIRNFKAFTGEDPTAYGFDERNMANFFMNKR